MAQEAQEPWGTILSEGVGGGIEDRGKSMGIFTTLNTSLSHIFI